ncbi:kinase-like domain-containing protein [Tanacetum coccineum]
MVALVRLQICEEIDDTWAWVALGPERQPDAATSAPGATEGASVVDEGDQAIPTPVQALPPPPAAARTMPQRMARLEEDVHEIRRALAEQREVIGAMAKDFSRFTVWPPHSPAAPLNLTVLVVELLVLVVFVALKLIVVDVLLALEMIVIPAHSELAHSELQEFALFQAMPFSQTSIVLRLNNNHLTGQIPPELGGLNRLKEFSVANNRLIGKVPFFSIYSASTDSYANNLGLCGGPLGPCKKKGHTNILFSGFEVGFPASTVLTMLLMFWRLPMSMNNMTLYRMIKKMKGRRNQLIPGTPNSQVLPLIVGYWWSGGRGGVTAMEKFTRPLRLVELETATNNFDNKNVIGYGNRGLMYKAMFPSGLLLAVKRLHMDSTGLAWLHYNKILRVAHLKINSKCILLDDKFEPKISNFGNSGILMNTSGIPSSVRNFVVPDSSLSPSPYKEDVYSFGILLLELVTGREPSTWTNSPTDHVCSRELVMIDESLMGQGFDEEIRETLKVAEKCIRAQTDGEIYMLQVYQEMHAIRISSNKILVDLCMDMEEN